MKVILNLKIIFYHKIEKKNIEPYTKENIINLNKIESVFIKMCSELKFFDT